MYRLLNRVKPAFLMVAAVFISVQFGNPTMAGETCVNNSEYRVEQLLPGQRPGQGERLEITMEIGTLAEDLSITVADEAGNILGGISAFNLATADPGQRKGASFGNFAIPLNEALQKQEGIKLQIWVEETGKPGRRPPTPEELKSVNLGVVRVRAP